MLVFQKKTGTPIANFADVSVLLKMEVSWFDSSAYNQSIAGNGDPHSAANAKFGTRSAAFTGTGDPYLTLNGSNFPDGGGFNFETGDFTVEAWVYPTTIPGGGVFYDMNVFGILTTTPPMFMFLRNSDLAPCLWNGTFQHTSTAGVPINTWSHVAWCRNSGTLRMFIDGVKVFEVAEPTDFSPIGSVFVGGHGAITGRGFNGYIDEVRAIKGAGIYTKNFTPPADEFPTS